MLLLLACATPDPDPVPDDTTTPAVPAITAAAAACDVDDAQWAFSAQADAWTGNGEVVLSDDGDYVEHHPMYSTTAASDGSSDTLALTLTIVADWRDAVAGTSTAFNCDAPLAGVLRIYTRDGADVADCRAFGEEPSRWQNWDPDVACEAVIEE
jgi:hypothetical protein